MNVPVITAGAACRALTCRRARAGQVLVVALLLAWLVAAAPAAAVTPLSATLQETFTGQATQTLYDQLGTAVAVSGDTALVGAQYFQAPTTYHRGEAYVYVRSGGVWQQEAVLTAPDETDGSYFGCSVAIQGDTAVVGAYGHLATAGSVYVFTRSAGVWSLQQQLNGPEHSQLGYSVAISGDTLIAGAPAYYPSDPVPPNPVTTGAARVYTRTGDVLDAPAAARGRRRGGDRPLRLVRRTRRRQRRGGRAVQERRHPRRRRRGLRVHARPPACGPSS